MSRAAMLEETKANLASLRESSGILALEAPAAYSLAYADMIYNTDMQHSRYVFETDTVPFAQMVTGGHIPSFSPWQNLSAGGDAAVLQMIDYNVYPAYLLTEASSEEFAQCHTNDVYSSQFDDYLDEIARVYAVVDPVLREISGASVTSRTCPADGVSVVRYDNGKTVIVNYTDTVFSLDGTDVPAMQAVCV